MGGKDREFLTFTNKKEKEKRESRLFLWRWRQKYVAARK